MNTLQRHAGRIQDRLFTIGAILATPQEKRGEKKRRTSRKESREIELLEMKLTVWKMSYQK
jgi:cob(I)alamin adenosyltransferase